MTDDNKPQQPHEAKPDAAHAEHCANCAHVHKNADGSCACGCSAHGPATSQEPAPTKH